MTDFSQTDSQRAPPDLHDAQLLAHAVRLCRKQHEAPHDADLRDQITVWREISAAHALAWHRAERQWQLASFVPPPTRHSLRQRLWYRLDLGQERMRHQMREHPRLLAIPALCLIALLVFPWSPAPENVASPAISADVAAPAQTLHYTSPARAQHVVTLADGSQVTLNWNSAIDVSFDSTSRKIALTRGEALFDVAPDPARPFVVRSGAVATRAVGTMFNVHVANDDLVRVTVTEGIVEVMATNAAPVTLVQGEQVEATNTAMGSVRAAQTDNATAWTQGMLIFREQALHEVLDELGRYTSSPLRTGTLFDPDQPVTATYFIERSDDALSLVASAFDLRLRTNPDGSVTVESAPPTRPF